MIDQAQATKLCEANELAFFRADVCLGSPQSFTLEDKASICDEMESTNKAIEDAIRRDFESMPPEFQARLPDNALRVRLHDAGVVVRNPPRKDAELVRRSACLEDGFIVVLLLAKYAQSFCMNLFMNMHAFVR